MEGDNSVMRNEMSNINRRVAKDTPEQSERYQLQAKKSW